jgi:hypothetical protein
MTDVSQVLTASIIKAISLLVSMTLAEAASQKTIVIKV